MLPVQRACQLGDLQLLMRDQGLVVGGPGLGDGQLRGDPRRPVALGQQRPLQRVDIVGQVVTGGRHAGIES